MPGIAESVCRISGGLKKKLKSLSDVATAYGLPANLSHEELTGLYLNVERSEIRQAYRTARANIADRIGIDPTWFEAISQTAADREAAFAAAAISMESE